MQIFSLGTENAPELERLNQQLRFIIEIDKLKSVLRRTLLIHEERRENSAEHSWHLALLAILLVEHADAPVDLLRVLKMVLIHDLVEIDAGDTYCYDEQALQDQRARELQAAQRLFGMLPADQQQEFHSLWEEFEARQTPEARFAAALDRLMPLLHNYHTQGKSWQEHGIVGGQVLARNACIEEGSAQLWLAARSVIEEAIAQGYLAAAKEE